MPLTVNQKDASSSLVGHPNHINNPMKLQDLFESPSDITKIVSHARNLTTFLQQLVRVAQDAYDRHGDMKKVRMILGSQKSRWFSANYPVRRKESTIQGTLELFKSSTAKKLANLKLYAQTANEDQESRSSHLDTLAEQLPNVLRGLASQADKNSRQQLLSAADGLINAYDRFITKLTDLKTQGMAKRPEKIKKVKQENLLGKQNSSAEDVVNELIRTKIPKELRGDIRKTISRMGSNKLQALMKIMHDMGIHESVEMDPIRFLKIVNKAIERRRKEQVNPTEKYPKIKKDKKDKDPDDPKGQNVDEYA